jgi:hypothetical protein
MHSISWVSFMIYVVTVLNVMFFAFITFKCKHVGGKFNFQDFNNSVNSLRSASRRTLLGSENDSRISTSSIDSRTNTTSIEDLEMSRIRNLSAPLLDGEIECTAYSTPGVESTNAPLKDSTGHDELPSRSDIGSKGS